MILYEDQNIFKGRKKCTEKINQKNIEIPPIILTSAYREYKKNMEGNFLYLFLNWQ